MVRKIKRAPVAELMERFVWLRYGHNNLGDITSDSRPILPLKSIRAFTGYTESYISQLISRALTDKEDQNNQKEDQ